MGAGARARGATAPQRVRVRVHALTSPPPGYSQFGSCQALIFGLTGIRRGSVSSVGTLSALPGGVAPLLGKFARPAPWRRDFGYA